MMVSTRGTKEQLEGSEKMVEVLSGTIQELWAFQMSVEAQHASMKHISMEAKLDAILKKLSIPDDTPEDNESKGSR